MEFNFYFNSLTDWALPLYIRWGKHNLEVSLLCFSFMVWLNIKEIESTPEDDLQFIKDYADQTMNMINENFNDIYKRMGTTTTSRNIYTVTLTNTNHDPHL